MTAADLDALIAMLDRLKLTAIRDQLDALLDEAARSDMTLRESLAFFVQREIARRDETISLLFDQLEMPLDRPRRHGAVLRTAGHGKNAPRRRPWPGGDPAELLRPVCHGSDAGRDPGQGP